MILCIKTNEPDAFVGIAHTAKKIDSIEWKAHRELADTIHIKIKQLLDNQSLQLSDLKGIIVFEGPGSFTGLRIGISVANAYADSLALPIVGSSGKQWLQKGLVLLETAKPGRPVVPVYGMPVRITQPKK